MMRLIFTEDLPLCDRADTFSHRPSLLTSDIAIRRISSPPQAFSWQTILAIH
jgi:hypothetical protein